MKLGNTKLYNIEIPWQYFIIYFIAILWVLVHISFYTVACKYVWKYMYPEYFTGTQIQYLDDWTSSC